FSISPDSLPSDYDVLHPKTRSVDGWSNSINIESICRVFSMLWVEVFDHACGVDRIEQIKRKSMTKITCKKLDLDNNSNIKESLLLLDIYNNGKDKLDSQREINKKNVIEQCHKLGREFDGSTLTVPGILDELCSRQLLADEARNELRKIFQ
ncbi:hypothetical protein ADUPG1_010777, partial [Aduncisulcus paluster]